MARMMDLIRSSQVPSYLMHAAVRGALRVPPEETIEILVYLALHNRVFGEQARMTLAGWDEKATKAVAADPRTSVDVLNYLISPKNLRPALLPVLLENRSVGQSKISELAVSGSREIVEAMLASERVKSSPVILKELRSNPALRANEILEIDRRLGPMAPPATAEPETIAESSAEMVNAEEPATPVESESADEAELIQAIEQYLKDNQAELEQEGHKPFEPIAIEPDHEEQHAAAAEPPAVAASESSAETPKTVAKPAIAKARRPPPEKEERRDSTLQKIAKLDIKGRISLAVRGSKEERSILIRDGTKLVALAVLESPKISDGEVEHIALQKNVLEAVLRAIPLKRRFAKNYSIMRNLVYNPRTPLDLSLGLMKNLLVHDLKNLSGNKEVSDTIRKLALRMYKQKTEKKKE